MEKQEQNLLKDNHGVALTMVMALLLIMTFLGGTMYAYTMQSLKTLEYGTNRQKAEYIARSGVEASVFMYQDAMMKNNTEHSGIQDFLKKTDRNGATSGEDIITNWVYLLKDGKTYVDGGSDDQPAEISQNYIGYFRVTIRNGEEEYFMPKADGTKEKKTQYVKHFISEGYCKGRKCTKKAYIVPLVDVTSKGWINDKGEIVLENAASDTTSMIQSSKVSIECGWIDDFIEQAKRKFGNFNDYLNKKYPFLGGKLPTYPESPRLKDLPVYIGATSGNMVLNAPKNADGKDLPIHFKQELKDHNAGFLSLENLFINGDLDTEPLATRFNSIILRGNQIVINGEINMYVYDPQTNNSNGFTDLMSGLAAKVARNYRFSTVILGTPSSQGTTVTDPMPKAAGGLGQCGQVFFGGDVYVNFITRNGESRKYKVFCAGETYYFDGNFAITAETDQAGNVTTTPLGIDLLKYFLDTEIEKQHYSPQVLQQFERTRRFYYNKSGTQNAYSAGLKTGQSPSMRKVDPQKNKKYDSVTDTVLPSPSEGSYIIWE